MTSQGGASPYRVTDESLRCESQSRRSQIVNHEHAADPAKLDTVPIPASMMMIGGIECEVLARRP
jgi:hypothetical protein